MSSLEVHYHRIYAYREPNDVPDKSHVQRSGGDRCDAEFWQQQVLGGVAGGLGLSTTSPQHSAMK